MTLALTVKRLRVGAMNGAYRGLREHSRVLAQADRTLLVGSAEARL